MITYPLFLVSDLGSDVSSLELGDWGWEFDFSGAGATTLFSVVLRASGGVMSQLLMKKASIIQSALCLRT